MRFLTPNLDERRSSNTFPTKILQVFIIKRMYVKGLA
jgi:hypothetical protein